MQGVLETAFRRPLKLASRTDRGVSSAGNVATVDLEEGEHPLALAHDVNRRVRGVAVEGVVEVPPDFDPRWLALGRRYTYLLGTLESGQLEQWIDLCSVFLGKHDFGLFSHIEDGQKSFKDLSHSAMVEIDGAWWWELESRSFLWHQVRGMVWSVERVIAGHMSAEALGGMLRGEGQPASISDAERLVLREVFYDPPLKWIEVATGALGSLLSKIRVKGEIAVSLMK